MHYRMGCSIEQYRSAIGSFCSRGRKRWRKVLDLRGVRRSRGLWWGALVVLVALAHHLQLHGEDDARCILLPIIDLRSGSGPFLVVVLLRVLVFWSLLLSCTGA